MKFVSSSSGFLIPWGFGIRVLGPISTGLAALLSIT